MLHPSSDSYSSFHRLAPTSYHDEPKTNPGAAP